MRKAPEKKAGQPEKIRVFDPATAEAKKEYALSILGIINTSPSIQDDVKKDVTKRCTQLIGVINKLSKEQEPADAETLMAVFSHVMGKLRKVVDPVIEERKISQKAKLQPPRQVSLARPATQPAKPVELPKPLLKIEEDEWKEPEKPAEPPKLSRERHPIVEPPKPVQPIVLEKPKPAPLPPKPVQPIAAEKPKPAHEPQKPEPKLLPPAWKIKQPQNEVMWERGGLKFTTRDFKNIHVLNTSESWAADFNEVGSLEVRIQRPGGLVIKVALKGSHVEVQEQWPDGALRSAVLKGNKFEGNLDENTARFNEGMARTIKTHVLMQAQIDASLILADLKEKAKEEQGAWKSAEDEWR